LHPAAALLRTDHPAVAIWQAHAGDDPAALATALGGGAEWAVITRPHFRVSVQAVDPATFACFGALATGVALGAACVEAAAIEPGFDAGRALARAEQWGVFAAAA